MAAFTTVSETLTSAQFDAVFSPLSDALKISHALIQGKPAATDSVNVARLGRVPKPQPLDKAGKWDWNIPQARIECLSDLGRQAWKTMLESKAGLDKVVSSYFPLSGRR